MSRYFTSSLKRSLLLFITFLCIVSSSYIYGQAASGSSYPVSCFKNSNVDSFEVEIEGLGEVMTYNLASDSVGGEIALMYYNIPVEKRSKSAKKLLGYATGRQLETWKNNSKVVAYKESKVGSSYISEVRLHLLIENIFLQVIVILDNNRVFEFDQLRDKNDKAVFDKLSEQLMKKECPS